jgi:hypothetical protein
MGVRIKLHFVKKTCQFERSEEEEEFFTGPGALKSNTY